MRRPRPTLAQATILGLAATGLTIGLLFHQLMGRSRAAILASGERIRMEVSERIGSRVEDFLRTAQDALESLERQARGGLLDLRLPGSVSKGLTTQLLERPELAELTFTAADSPAGPGWQVAAVRGEGSDIQQRGVLARGAGFVERVASGDGQNRERDVADPTRHPTFQIPLRVAPDGRVVWSDLHYSGFAEEERRVVVTAMKVVRNLDDGVVGVFRAGVLAEQIDGLVRLPRMPTGEADPHRLLIADESGRLVSRLSLQDRLVEQPDESLRVDPARLPAALARVLEISRSRAAGSAPVERLDVDGETYLVTLRPIRFTQGWHLCILVPESHYLGPLDAVRDRLIATALLSLLALATGAGLVLGAVRRGFGAVQASTERMSRLDFSPASEVSGFRDVDHVMDSLEQAKTALRAMGKYLPLSLVRQLYSDRREPTLGSEPATVSLMFTDIRDFTSLAEAISGDELAQLLGRYLEVTTEAIHGKQGIIDKYVGDAIMAMWNAPRPVARHPQLCCEAALQCRDALSRLYSSAEWKGPTRLETRFGLHTAEVMVGHFGAPDRLSYTAMGDGVNLAARLESLNKHYGTSFLASQAIVDAVAPEFAFRLVDAVVVKGRHQPELVYELLGRHAAIADPEPYRRYEQALRRYRERDWSGALGLLEGLADDGPALTLSGRCKKFLHDPPPEAWDGAYRPDEK